MDTQEAEAVRLRIVTVIGRDSTFITSADKERHFDPVSFAIYYGGKLFLRFAAKFWEKVQEEGAKKLVNVAWEQASAAFKSLSEHGETASDAEQIEQIKKVSAGLGQIGQEIESQYLETFISAGQEAVEARLRQDHIPEAKAKRIAAAVAQEVREQARVGVG